MVSQKKGGVVAQEQDTWFTQVCMARIEINRPISNPISMSLCLQIVKKVELEAQRGKGPADRAGNRRRRNPVEDLKREVAIMRTLRHKNIVSLQVCVMANMLPPFFSLCDRLLCQGQVDSPMWHELNFVSDSYIFTSGHAFL